MKKMMRVALVAAALGMLCGVPALTQSGQDLFQQALVKEQAAGDLNAAIAIYQRIVRDFSSDRTLVARALVQMGRCYEKLGEAQTKQARATYERVVREFGDQSAMAAEARARLAALTGPAAARGTALAVRQLWAGPEVGFEGGMSPDGRYVGFTDWGTGDLAVRDLVRGETRRLTNNGPGPIREFADSAVFSPDGKQLCYSWYAENGTFDLRLVGIDGTGQRVLPPSKEFTYFSLIQWSRDGRHILSLVYQKGAANALALISPIDGTVRVLRSIEWRLPQGASFSPDGRWIAYDGPYGEDPGQYDIHLLATDGSRDVPLVEHPSSDTRPIWSPDGRQVLFVSDRGGTLGLWSIPVLDGRAQGEPQLVKPDVGRIHPFVITGSGALHYGLIAGTGDVYEVTIDPRTGRPTSAPTTAFKHYVGFNGTPDYSPDGQYLAGISVRGTTTGLIPGNRSLVVRSLKTGEEREIRLDFAPGWEMKWSPDGRFVLIPGRDIKGGVNTYQVDVNAAVATVVSQRGPMTNQQGSQRGWFHDQKSIFLVSWTPKDEQGEGRYHLLRQDLSTGKTEDLFAYDPAKTWLLSLTLSPDGKQFACWSTNWALQSLAVALIPATGGEPRAVFSMKETATSDLSLSVRGLAWTPDGRYLVFARKPTTATKAMGLWRVAVEGGQPEELGPLMESVFDVVVHPGGSRIAFSTRRVKLEVWLMENFLPAAKTPK